MLNSKNRGLILLFTTIELELKSNSKVHKLFDCISKSSNIPKLRPTFASETFAAILIVNKLSSDKITASEKLNCRKSLAPKTTTLTFNILDMRLTADCMNLSHDSIKISLKYEKLF